MLLPELRQIVCNLHTALPQNNLVAWTSGNISARDPQTGLVVIKPSGVKFEDLTPEKMVVVNLDGDIVEAAYKAQAELARFDQAKVDRICETMSKAALREAARLGAMAVEETGYGVPADKQEKNRFAAEDVWNYHIGGYQVMEKYLKDRKGNEMNNPSHYCQIATCISKTIEVQKKIDSLFSKAEKKIIQF